MHSSNVAEEDSGFSLATFPLLAKCVGDLSWIGIRNLTNHVHRTYHTRKEVAQLIFKVIDADGETLVSQAHLGCVVLTAILGSGLVAQDELTEALRAFGEPNVLSAFK